METRENRPDPDGRAEPAARAVPGTARVSAPESAPERAPGGDPAGFRIRPFRDGDAEAVVALWQASGLVRPWNDPHYDIDRARGARSSGTSEIFVAVAGDGEGCIVGSVMAGFDGHRGWVYYLAAAPDCRSRGLGERLMRHAETWLEGLGAPKVMLMIREENEAVRRFYEGIGYGVERRTIMSRWLKAPPPEKPG